MDSSDPVEPEKNARIFSGGIARALLANRSFTSENLKHLIIAMTKECIDTLYAYGFEWSDPGLMSVADAAQKFVDDLGDRGDLRLELCADLIGAIAVYHDAATNGAGDRHSTARCVSAAILIGSFDAMRAAAQVKVFDDASLRQIMHQQASQHAKTHALRRQGRATQWKARAFQDFKGRTNKGQSAEAWAAANHKKYGVKSGTLAKALQQQQAEERRKK